MIFKLLRNIDIFYLIPRISFSGKEKFQTKIGGILTIFLVFAILITSLSFFDSLANHRNPSTITSEKFLTSYPLINFSKIAADPPFLAFGLNDLGKLNLIEEGGMDKYFEVDYSEVNFQKYSIFDSNINKTITMFKETARTIDTEKCSPEKIKALMKNDIYVEELLKTIDISRFTCPKYDESKRNVSVQGTWGDENFTILSYRINFCSNSSLRPDKICASAEEISKLVKELIMHILVKTPVIDLNNYGSPIKYIFTPLETSFLQNKTKLVEIFLSKGSLNTYDGLFGNRYNQQSFVSFEGSKEVIKEGTYNLIISFRAKNNEKIFNRQYDKLPDVVAKVGGMLNALFISVGLLMSLLNRNLYRVELVNGILAEEEKARKKLSKLTVLSSTDASAKTPKELKLKGIKGFDTINIFLKRGKISKSFEEKYAAIHKILDICSLYKLTLDLKRVKVKIKSLEALLKNEKFQMHKLSHPPNQINDNKLALYIKSEEFIPSERQPTDLNRDCHVWTRTLKN